MSLRYGKPGAGVAALPPGLAGGAAGGGDAYVGGGIFGSGRPSMPVPIHDDTPYVPQPQLEDPYEQAEMMNKESDTLFGNDQNTGINFDAYDEIPVETSGNDVPAHANRFEDMGLNPALMENIRRCKYTKPTPVQKYAIPIGMAGRDIMACAQTGSGKTAAFVFPILAQLMASGYTPKERMRIAEPAALIMAPTRELTIQIYEETRKFSYQTGIRPVVMYGGAPGSAQLQSMEHGCDIIVATPGRLADFIERVRVTLEQCKFLVLDEADRMLDMGFEPQIRRIVEGEDMPPTGHRQTMLFSATFPKEIQRLAADFLYNYIFVTVGRVGSSTDLIMQHIEYIQGGLPAKRDMLLQALTAVQGLTLVFVRTKSEADSLVDFLLGRGIQATTIHGDKSQGAREQALRDFRSAHKRVLVATDVAARGLDIPHVTHVINYDMPDDIDDYVHRIGRTGRAGKKGLATAFFDDNAAGLAGALVEVMHETGQAVPDWLNEYAGSGYISSAPPRGGRGFGGRDFREEHGGAGAYSHERLGRHGGGGGGGGGADAFAGNGADAARMRARAGFGGGDGGFGAVNDDSGW